MDNIVLGGGEVARVRVYVGVDGWVACVGSYNIYTYVSTYVRVRVCDGACLCPVCFLTDITLR